MVASFERSGPSRSVSPDKGPSSVKRMDSLKHSSDPETDSAAINPIQSRPRPQSDIFPSRSSYAMAPASEDTATATNGDTERKKEPRLLPYPPSQQILPEYTAFGTSPQSNNIQGMSTFGPYDSTQDASFAPFPSGVLPFSPQSTGTTIPSPSPSDHLDQYGQPQSFDALYTNTFVDGVRPLPLPPHPGQMYQPPVSMQGYGGAVIDDVNYVSENGVYSPHGQHHHHHIVTAPVPHVQVQHVPGEPSHVQTPVVDVDIDQQQQQQPLHQLLQPRSQPVLPILAPQPRHGGRESPTKLLEEKLEEILEPRPRSRVVSGAGISTSPSHSRVLESSSPSRPRSRVASMNLTGNGNGSVRVGSRVPSTASLSAVMNGVGEKGSDVPDVGNGGSGLLGVGGPSHPHRTRVISLSSRTHSHRLSGVEVWGENHRHIVVPPDEELDVQYNAEEVNVKEVEGEEEVGIEALLEKETPDLSMPVPEENGNGNGNGHGREGSGSGSTGSVVHSRAGSLREPKSAVITVVERKPSARLRRDEAGVGGGEESMEALLAKADSASVRKKMNGNGNGKRRTPLSGVEAWEMINVDTVKHVEGDGMGRSIEDIFSPVPVRPPTPSHARVQARARASPSPPKTKLKPKDKSDEAGRLDELDKKEKELERSVGETRRMVEEIRGRLGSVERWIAEKERLAEVGLESEKRREEERRNGGGGVGIVGWPVDVVKRVLSASRVPGMLGLSAWLGVGPSSEPSSASENRQDTQTRMRKETLVRRCARLGLGLSTYAVLFGIGVCVALLRLLGKRPGLPARFGGAGAGVRMVNGALRG
ncbi:hypothetical protein P691DRAFT_39409 [Macrolepiota fuliginosa MF-IS2]|uniref:Uncharacterized protein n=1 Tax=Macrolepiota fuliginosa MF-IS2 TaxID=1400762 RepID=A0A9P5XD51_9AGAR|nr:hypothetical protein P691DRAFT_39409 [Macrolepiota fuliginosa MF-IS2]